MERSIIHIHEELCNGCGACIDACHEGALELVDGKARLVSDIYCDGLGACLPNCPTGAIEIIDREAEDFDEAAVEKRAADMSFRGSAGETPDRNATGGPKQGGGHHLGHGQGHGLPHNHGMGGCPGSMAARIERKPNLASPIQDQPLNQPAEGGIPSELQQWPIQISLLNPAAPFFQDANLLIAADCTAYAYGDFHRDFIKGRIALIGCPKLDDTAYYVDKLAAILSANEIKSVTVVRMTVPCCGGIVQTVKQAMLQSGNIVPYREVTVGLDGQLLQ